MLFIIINCAVIFGTKIEKLPLNGKFFSPVFTPDGNNLILIGENKTGIYLYNFDKIKKLSDSKCYGLSFSPDGKKIVFTNDYGISILDITTERETLIFKTIAPSNPVWLEDNTIVFSSSGNLVFIDEAGKIFKEVKNISATFIDVNKQLFVFEEDEKSYILKDNQKSLISEEIGPSFKPIASPDGNYIIFSSERSQIFLVDRTNNNIRFIGTGFNKKFSPDSKKLIFQYATGRKEDAIFSGIILYDLKKRKSITLIDLENVIEIEPSFSPDGKMIVFTTTNGEIFIYRSKKII